MSDLRVAINIPIQSEGNSGGVQQFVAGLLSGLSSTDTTPIEYILVTNPRDPRWVEPYMDENMTVHPRPLSGPIERIRDALPPSVEHRLKTVARPVLSRFSEPGVPQSNGFFESLDVDVVHFPTQAYVETDLPTIYNPHDLQHRHLPEFFSDQQLRQRDLRYRRGCSQSEAIAVASNWVKSDIITQYGIDQDSIYVIPLAPPLGAFNENEHVSASEVIDRFDLPTPFCLYPAQTWPHKNHIRLLESIATVRDDYGVQVNLVCTGKRNEHWPNIRERINELALEEQVSFLGFVSEAELRALYAAAQFTIIPTLFEAASFPMYEAWHEECPVACSTVTSLPQIAGDAALLFDPTSVEEIASAIYRLSTDESLREKLRKRAVQRRDSLSWARTAELYELLYRRASGGSLSEKEKVLINKAIEGELA